MIGLHGLDPETALASAGVAELKLDPFLRRVVMGVDRIDFTVRDVVAQAANVLGGVHAGNPRDLAQQAMAGVSAAFRIGRVGLGSWEAS